MLRSGGLNTSSSDLLTARRRGSVRLAIALAGAIAALAVLGRSADPASKLLPAATAPGGSVLLGAAIALTGNANLYGQDQRMGLTLAQRWFEATPHPRPVRLQLEDGGSDEASAIAAFSRRRSIEEGMRSDSRYFATVRRAISMPLSFSLETMASSESTSRGGSSSIICLMRCRTASAECASP